MAKNARRKLSQEDWVKIADLLDMNFEETTIEKVKMEFLKLDDPNVRKVK